MARASLKFETLENRDLPATSFSPLDDRMVDQMNASTGRIGFSVVTPGLLPSTHHGTQTFGTSSTIKLGILYELFRKIDRTRSLPANQFIRLSTEINVGAQFGENQQVEATGAGKLDPNQLYTLDYLARTMIDNSNNWATNRLINYLGVANINRAFADLGLSHTRVDRYMTGPGSVSMHGLGTTADGEGPLRDYRAGHDNESTPAEMTSLLRQIHENSGLLHPDSHAAYWEIMGLNGSGLVSRTYSESVFSGPGVSWGNAMDIALKAGLNNWAGSAGSFTDDPTIGSHHQRSEAGRIVYSDGRVVFFAMFVDEAQNVGAAELGISRAGFEIAREYSPATVTTTPFGAFLDDGHVTLARGTDDDDDFRIEPDSTGTGIAVTRNFQTLREFPAFTIPMDTLRIVSGDGADSFLVRGNPTPSFVTRLEIDGGIDADFFDITASTTLPMTLNGSRHTATGGDVLRFRGPGTLTGAADPFTIASPSHQPVEFRGMETYFLPPTITDVPDVSAPRGSVVGPIPFAIGDAESPLYALIVTASVGTAFLPNASLVIGGTGANRTLTYQMPRKTLGPVAITVRVTDETGRSASSTFHVTPVNPPSYAAPEFSVGSDAGGGVVELRDSDNTPRFALTPFGEAFAGGVRTASGDFTGDGIADLVAASGFGMPGQVIVFDGVTQERIPTPLPGNQPFGEAFTRGILVAAGDLNADGLSDLIVTAEAGGGARVRIFQSTGRGFVQRSDFIALIGGDGTPDARGFRGGSRAAVSDINGDGTGDLIWAAGAGGGPRVATFDGRRLDGGSNTAFKLSGDFFALSPMLRDGCYLAGGDINGDGIGDVIFGGGSGAPPQVVGYSGSTIVQNQFLRFADFRFGTDSGQGLRVAVKDLNGDGIGDVIVSSAPGAGSRVAAFDGKNITGSSTGNTLFDYKAFANGIGGVFVG